MLRISRRFPSTQSAYHEPPAAYRHGARSAVASRLRVDPGFQHFEPQAAQVGKGTRERRRHRPYQIMDGASARAPVDAAVLGTPAPEIGALGEIERTRLGLPAMNFGNDRCEDLLRGLRHPHRYPSAVSFSRIGTAC